MLITALRFDYGGRGRASLFPVIFALLMIGGPAAADWPVARGNAFSSGYVDQTLPKTIDVAWQIDIGESVETTPVIAGSRLFVTDVMGGLTAVSIDPKDAGTKLWNRSLEVGFNASPSIWTDPDPKSDKQIVIAGDVDGTVIAFDGADGRQLWRHAAGGEIDAGPGIDGDRVLVTSQDGNLTALSVHDGGVEWTYETDDQIRCSATVAGGQTFLGGCDAKLHRIDLATGKSAGDPIEIDGPTGSTPAVSGGTMVLPIMSGIVYGFDLSAGTTQWTYEDPKSAQEYRTDAAVDDSIAVVASARKHIDALSIATGKRLWRSTLRRRSDASPIIAGSDVWIAASDGRLIRLDKTDGREKWVYEIRGSFYAAPAIDDGKLYVADDKGILRCFQ